MQVTIEKIIAGGQGLARRQDGPVLLTRFVLPGEKVEVRETARHRGYAEAELVRVLEPSPDRVAPPCPHYLICGGCDFQHIAAERQLSIKQHICGEAIQRAGLPEATALLQPTLPSLHTYGYRTRIRLKVSATGEPGFYRFRSRQIVPIAQCSVAADGLNRALSQLRAASLSALAAAGVREVDLQESPADGHIHALLHGAPPQPIARPLVADLANKLPAVRSFWRVTATGVEFLAGAAASDLLRQDIADPRCGAPFSLQWPPGSFSQVNAEQNGRLISLVLDLAGEVRGRRVLDLFCGMGNFSIPFALCGAQITGVELNPASIAAARNNAAAAGCPGDFLAQDVGRALSTPPVAESRPALVVLDPPRQGLGKDCARLAGLEAERILYISCDPATLMRDLALLSHHGYHLQSLAPVDMFPQTHHIETVALLEKN